MHLRVLFGLAVATLLIVGPAAARAQQCDDYNQCTANDMCREGECTGTLQSGGGCDDFNDCTVNDRCGPDGDCVGDPRPAQYVVWRGLRHLPGLRPDPGRAAAVPRRSVQRRPQLRYVGHWPLSAGGLPDVWWRTGLSLRRRVHPAAAGVSGHRQLQGRLQSCDGSMR